MNLLNWGRWTWMNVLIATTANSGTNTNTEDGLSNFYTNLRSWGSNNHPYGMASSDGSAQIDKLPQLAFTVAGWIWRIDYEVAIVILACAFLLAVLFLAFSSAKKRGENKNYLIKVMVVTVIVMGIAGLYGTVERVGQDIGFSN